MVYLGRHRERLQQIESPTQVVFAHKDIAKH